MSTKQLPPYPSSNLNAWAKQLYEYLISQSPVRGSVEPTPILLPHIVDSQMPRATVAGILLYDPVNGAVLVSTVGAWETVFSGQVPLEALSNVVITSPAVGDKLTFNGTNWVNTP